jgi:hypothetical protein
MYGLIDRVILTYIKKNIQVVVGAAVVVIVW